MQGNWAKGQFIKLSTIKKEKWLEHIAKNFDYQQPIGLNKLFWSKSFYFFSWFCLVFPGILMWKLHKQKINKLFANLQSKRFAFFKTWFNNNYDDLKVTKEPNWATFKTMINKNKGINIPQDAAIKDFSNGYTFVNKEGSEINIALVKWVWQRSSGKSTLTFYQRKIYAWISSSNLSFKKSHYFLEPELIKNDLENDLSQRLYCKNWIYQDNHLTKILSPENLVKVKEIKKQAAKIKNGPTFSISKKNQNLVMSINYEAKSDPFLINVPTTVDLTNKKVIVKAAYEDLIKDLEQIQNWLKVISQIKIIFLI